MTARPSPVGGLAELVRAGRLGDFVARARELEPADLADVLARLDAGDRLAAVRALPPELSGHALAAMPDEAHAEATLAALPAAEAAEIVDQLDDDDAADLLGELAPETQERILAEVTHEHRADVGRLLGFREDTAGGRMTTAVVSVLDDDTAAGALDAIRRQAEEVEDFYQVFVVDRAGRLRGILPLNDLVVSPPDRLVRDFMEPADVYVTPEVDQEEVARLMARYDLPSVPVVDADGRLVGRVTFDDVVDVVQEESTEDLLQFGGTSPGEEIAGGWAQAVRARLPWLLLNLLTAFAAAFVVYSNQGLIEQAAILAVLMPIIAGMGGNAGTQALAVTVRRLALGLIAPGHSLRVIGKEVAAGLVNGLVTGLVVGLVALGLGEPGRLGLVVFLAMAGNLLVAGFAGAFIPLVLQRFGVDPAIASSIFVTTFTDICGFGLLLGLAAVLLL